MDTYANASDHPPSREIAAKIMAARGRGLSSVLGKYNKYNVASRCWPLLAPLFRLLPYLARVFQRRAKDSYFPINHWYYVSGDTRRDVSQREPLSGIEGRFAELLWNCTRGIMPFSTIGVYGDIHRWRAHQISNLTLHSLTRWMITRVDVTKVTSIIWGGGRGKGIEKTFQTEWFAFYREKERESERARERVMK